MPSSAAKKETDQIGDKNQEEKRQAAKDSQKSVLLAEEVNKKCQMTFS